MFDKVIPNKEIEIKVYALQYKTGPLYIKSEDNSNAGTKDKTTGTVANNIFLVPAYTYEEAISMLHDKLLSVNDFFTKEVKIVDYSCMKLSSIFDWAYEMYKEKDFKEDTKKETSS